MCPSGPCFPTIEETQAHPKGPCPEGTLYSTVGEPEAQRGNLTHLRSHSRDGRTTTPAQCSGAPSPAHHPPSSPPPGSRTIPGQRSPDSVMSKGWGRWSPRPSPGRGHRTWPPVTATSALSLRESLQGGREGWLGRAAGQGREGAQTRGPSVGLMGARVGTHSALGGRRRLRTGGGGRARLVPRRCRAPGSEDVNCGL